MKVYSYVVEHDNGYGPNPYFRFCTLCGCKFEGGKNIVQLAKVGDWVIGTGGKSKRSAGHGKLVYAMRVDEKLTRWEYFTDSRFERKKPVKTGTHRQTRGDNEDPVRMLRSTRNLLSSRDTSTTSGRTPLIFENSSSKRISVDSTT